jgi:RRXRR protein/HNH endonuclease
MRKVYVISKEGKPLMPCLPCKAKKLLKAQKAKVVQLYPFTIQLKFEVENEVQEITLGIDPGFHNIGFSCVTTQSELASGTIYLDGKTSERLSEKARYRRGRRNKLWYRKSRFKNRKRVVGWLPPSIQRRYKTHLKIICQMKALMPISKIIIEVAQFDIQKIQNNMIEGIEYQQGDLYGYQNMRSYLMAREKGCCQWCKKPFEKGNPSHIHHIVERANGGTDRAKNLAILHKKCHEQFHKKGLKLSPNRTYKASIYMSIIRNKFRNDVQDLMVTYGYKTFTDRINLGLEKTHYNDAFVIAEGTTQKRAMPSVIQQKRRNNRVLQLNRKGFAPSIRKQRYPIQPKDLVWVEGKKEIAKGVHNHGTRVIIERTKKSIALKKVEKTYHWGSFCHL